MTRRPIEWLIFALASLPLASQEQAPGSTRVNATGRVIHSVTSAPIADLRLRMECSAKTGLGGAYDATTNSQGEFTFSNVPDDVCGVQIEGHLLSSEYSYHANGLSDRPWIIKLIPAVTISGIVADEKGSPIWGANIYVGRSILAGGERSQIRHGGYTDQRGQFRITIPQESNGYAIADNRYRLCVEHLGSVQTGPPNPHWCYSEVADMANAQWFELNPGQSRHFAVRLLPVVPGAVSGTITGPAPNTLVNLTRLDSSDFTGVYFPDATPQARNGGASEFSISRMLPGKYRVGASSGAKPPLTAVADIEVRSGETTSVALHLSANPILHGTVRTDDGSPLKKGEYLELHVGSALRVPVGDDGAFRGPVGKLGTYRLALDPPHGWTVASATMGNRDVLAEDIHTGPDNNLEPLEIVLTRAVGTIEVSVAPKELLTEGRIMLLRRFGSRLERARHLINGTATIPVPGKFVWDRVPPGTYLVFALSTLDVPYLEADFLKQHQEHIREVHVRRNEVSRIELNLLDLRH